jgi:hypothetical protein
MAEPARLFFLPTMQSSKGPANVAGFMRHPGCNFTEL